MATTKHRRMSPVQLRDNISKLNQLVTWYALHVDVHVKEHPEFVQTESGNALVQMTAQVLRNARILPIGVQRHVDRKLDPGSVMPKHPYLASLVGGNALRAYQQELEEQPRKRVSFFAILKGLRKQKGREQ